MLEAALSAGIASAGGTALLAGVVPTPAVSRLVIADGCEGGVVISASHNPFADNGIKLMGPDGKKLPDEVELEIERRMGEAVGLGLDASPTRSVGGEAVGVIEELPGAGPRYVDDLLAAVRADLSGMRVLLDCAHGAAYRVAPLAFTATGARVETAFAEPDGVNINAGCGSTHVGPLSSLVAQGDFDLGLAFDGDADRVLAVDATGRPVDGDQILTILASRLSELGQLANDTVVVTSMSNLGFHRAMRERGIHVEVTDVGDRYVLERMLQTGAVLGGEQSGHVIYLPAGATGDGLQTGLLLCDALRASGKGLDQAASAMARFPQVLVNVPVQKKDRLKEAAVVWSAVEEEEAALGDDGRIVLRPSGTESLIRVMVEAPTEERCREVAGRLAEVVERCLV